MAMTTAQFADLMDPGFRVIHEDVYRGYPKVYPTIFNELTSERHQEKHSGVSEFGLVPEKAENTSITYDDRVQLYDKTYTWTSHALGFKISRENIADDLSGAMRRSPAALARSNARTEETLAVSVFNNAFSGSYLGPDGKALCATDHPAYGNRTFANTTSAAALSHTALIAARLRMLKMDDFRGNMIMLEPKTILIPPDIEETLDIIIRTDRKSGSANWDYNLLNNVGLSKQIWNYLTSTTAWFMLTAKEQHTLNWYWREKPSFDKGADFDTMAAKWSTFFRCGHGWDDFRGVDGNAGA